MQQGRLLAQLRLRLLAGGDVTADRQVLARPAPPVHERHDGRVDPVEAPVLRAVADFAAPHAPARDGPPQLADELLGVMTRVDEAMVLTEELVAAVLGDGA